MIRNELSEKFLEPRLAAVFAVGIAECGFENLSFAVSANRLHDDDHWNQHPKDWAVNHQYKSGKYYGPENVDWIADFRINAVRD